jgi:hypothetical protein
MVSRFEHGEGIEELVPKSHFLDLDEDLEIVNKGSKRGNNNVKSVSWF